MARSIGIPSDSAEGGNTSVVIDADKMSTAVTGLLASTDDHEITLADRSPEILDRLCDDGFEAERAGGGADVPWVSKRSLV
jgi:hypothetical protein